VDTVGRGLRLYAEAKQPLPISVQELVFCHVSVAPLKGQRLELKFESFACFHFARLDRAQSGQILPVRAPQHFPAVHAGRGSERRKAILPKLIMTTEERLDVQTALRGVQRVVRNRWIHD